MANEIDPASSALEALSDLGKRIFYFSGTALWGVCIGLLSAWINHLISGKKPEGSLSVYEQLDIEPVMTLPDMKYIFIGVSGVIPMFIGLLYIIRGSTKLSPFIAVLVGSSLLTILSTTGKGWNLHFTVWMNLTVLTMASFWLIKKWHKKERDKWEAELDAIYQENKRLRAEREIQEQEPVTREEMLTFTETIVQKPEVSPIKRKTEE